jgi:hypothetical protein
MTDLPPTSAPLPPEFFDRPLSARVLDDFALCPRKFLLAHFTNPADDQRYRGGPAVLHQAVRQSIIDLWQAGGRPQMTASGLLDRFAAHWDGRLCSDAREEETLHQQGLLMLAEYYTSLEGETRLSLATDLRLTGAVGEARLVAVADLILQLPGGPPEAWRLVTSRHPLSASELQQNLSARLLWLLHRQTSEAGQLMVHALRPRRTTLVNLSPDDESYLRHDLQSRVARLRREREFAPHKGDHCRWCRSRPQCPAWPRRRGKRPS